MKPYVWKEGMSLEEQKDGAYWERNMMALWMANYANKAWRQSVHLMKLQGSRLPQLDEPEPCGWYYQDTGFEGWSRVVSLFDGSATFHVPDGFDLGELPMIEPNWDGHSTEDKWGRIMRQCNIGRPRGRTK